MADTAAASPLQPPLERSSLEPEMPVEWYEQIVDVTHELISRRFATMRRMTDIAAQDVNLNPFLMLAMAPAYNIFSPLEAAEYAQYAKMPHGDATAFGRFVEDRVFPIFGAGRPPEKAADPSLYSPIDGEVTVDGIRYLTTYKSGPWTMNQSHANEMVASFPAIHAATGCDIIIGITYGKRSRLNNKPAVVERGTGAYVHTLAGRELWEFLSGVRDAHIGVYAAIREAQDRFALDHGGKTFYEHMLETRLLLAQSFRNAFGLSGVNDDMWEVVFRNSF